MRCDSKLSFAVHSSDEANSVQLALGAKGRDEHLRQYETSLQIRHGASVPQLPHADSAIADYLDRETARLDALVAAKERVLELLSEKRKALIAHAVTRGLDPRVPLRESGIAVAWEDSSASGYRTIEMAFPVNETNAR